MQSKIIISILDKVQLIGSFFAVPSMMFLQICYQSLRCWQWTVYKCQSRTKGGRGASQASRCFSFWVLAKKGQLRAALNEAGSQPIKCLVQWESCSLGGADSPHPPSSPLPSPEQEVMDQTFKTFHATIRLSYYNKEGLTSTKSSKCVFKCACLNIVICYVYWADGWKWCTFSKRWLTVPTVLLMRNVGLRQQNSSRFDFLQSSCLRTTKMSKRQI